jgi:hypothetical protein
MDMVMRERRWLQETQNEIARLRAEFAHELKALTSELRAAKVELHNVRAIQMFADLDRDFTVPLQ